LLAHLARVYGQGACGRANVNAYNPQRVPEHRCAVRRTSARSTCPTAERRQSSALSVTDDECARAALFLVSDYASAVSGAVLDANGGEGLP